MALTITSGPWTADQAEDFLSRTVIPVRLASIRKGSDGQPWPVVQSLWFTYRHQSLWCATQASSGLVARLRQQAAVGFEISRDEPPYCGVRGTGQAEVLTDAADLLAELISRYGQMDTALASWLLSRVDREVAIRIGDLKVSTWDYAARMQVPGGLAH
ncbi:MAG: hypothetical protein ACKOE2_14935 [Actinomycetales bacterium]